MSTRDDWLGRFQRLRQFQRNGQRAPHKPLLVLLALGDLAAGRDRQHTFQDIDDRLGELLRRFGPPRRPSPEYPFTRLVNDEVWETPGIDACPTNAGQRYPSHSALLKSSVTGTFPLELHELLQHDTGLVTRIAEELLEKNFPDSMHAEILDAVGLGSLALHRRARDASFRPNVLQAYQNRCAVCHLDASLDGMPYLLDAAHIRWHNMEGPDEVTNGLALCATHHRAFDRGAIGLSLEYRIQVSAAAMGGERHDDVLLRHNGEKLLAPYDPDLLPCREHIEWHTAQVFREPGRPPRMGSAT